MSARLVSLPSSPSVRIVGTAVFAGGSAVPFELAGSRAMNGWRMKLTDLRDGSILASYVVSEAPMMDALTRCAAEARESA